MMCYTAYIFYPKIIPCQWCTTYL